MGVIINPTDWDDWLWVGTGVNPPGAPVAAVLTEVNTDEWHWVFGNNAVMAFPSAQLTHAYKEGTDITPHIHWTPTTTATYTGTWTLLINAWLDAAQGTARSTQVSLTAAFNAALTAGQMQSQNFSAVLAGTNRKISSIASLTLKLALTAGTGCALLGLDGHHQKDRAGSVQITSKT